MNAKDRPFTQWAAQFVPHAKQRLAAQLCPLCGGLPLAFDNDMSKREHEISGLCQECQDREFGPVTKEL